MAVKSDAHKAYEDKYKEYLTSYKTVKTSLQKIVKNESSIGKITNAVFMINQIITHTYQFLKLYCLHNYKINNKLPIINEKLINQIMKVLCTRNKRGQKPSKENKILQSELKSFYDNHYKKLLPENLNLSYTNLNTVLDYEKVNIFTCINTHISEHFEKFVNRYINVKVNKEQNINHINKMVSYKCNITLNDCLNGENTTIQSSNILDKTLKKKMVNMYCNEINKLKRDILYGTNTCSSKYKDIKNNIMNEIFPEYTFEYIMNTVIDNHFQQKINIILNAKQYTYGNSMDYINSEKKTSININLLDKTLQEQIIKYYNKEIELLKYNILNNIDLKTEEHKLLKEKILDQFSQTSIIKQLDKDPLILLSSLIKMSINNENKGKRSINCFPLRTNIIPKYIKIDTTTLVHLLFPDDANKGYYLTKGRLKLLQKEIWLMFFDTKNKVFRKKGYEFNHQITTDGVGCSILLIREDLYDPTKIAKVRSMTKPYQFREYKYINELSEEDKIKLRKYNHVGCDPGKSDLFYSTNGDTKIIEVKNDKNEVIRKKYITTTFRYSQNQRRYETKSKQYSKKIDQDKKDTKLLTKYLDSLKTEDDNLIKESMTIKELETVLSRVNSKSCIYSNTEDYIKTKNYINHNLQEYYKKELFRKLKWYSYINIQKHESKIMNEFKRIYGSPENTVVFMGDYGGGNLKNCEPTKGKGLRKMFKRAGYSLFLVDEYNTSKINFVSSLENEKFRLRRNPRPYRQSVSLVHGLLRDVSVKSGEPMSKQTIVNRDFNGSMNILSKAKSILNNAPIKACLSR